MEVLPHRRLNHCVSEGIRYAPKTGAKWGQEFGGGHSTDDGEDNKTSPEGRTSASVNVFDEGGIA